MLKLRDEVSTFMKYCERLIVAATMGDADAKLTADECRAVNYYRGELAKITATTAYIQPSVLLPHSDGDTSP
jgi:hypothetical protein